MKFSTHITRFMGLVILYSTLITSLNAQVRLKVNLERDSILIGEQIQLKYTVFRNDAEEIEWPEFDEKIEASDGSSIEILEQSQLRVVKEEGNQVREEKSFVITVFDSGFYVIPPMVFSYKTNQDSIWKKMDSEAQLLSVYSVELGEKPEAKAIKDVYDMPFEFAEIKYQLLILAIVLLILIGAYLWWRKRPKSEPKVPEPEPVPDIPPYELAMQKLQSLESKKLWQSGELKAFYSELSEILREYMEGRYEFPALESTTDEIVDRLYRKDIDRELKIKVKEFLVLSDLVKFAKSLPKEDEHKQSFKLVLEFLRATKPSVNLNQKEEGNA